MEKLPTSTPPLLLSQLLMIVDFLSVQILMNVSTVHIAVTHKRLVLTQTEATAVLVKQDSLAMVLCAQVCNIRVPLLLIWRSHTVCRDMRLESAAAAALKKMATEPDETIKLLMWSKEKLFLSFQ